MGGGIAGVEFLTAFPYFAAIALVVGSSESPAAKASLIVLYDVVYILPLVAIVVACGLLGDRAGQSLAPVADWISTRWPIVVAPLAGRGRGRPHGLRDRSAGVTPRPASSSTRS